MADLTSITTVHTLSGGFATTAAMYETPERASSRAKNEVTLIPVNLEGELISHLTANYFGFTYSPAEHETGLFAKPSYLGYEVHRLKDGDVMILGYASADAAKKIGAGEGGDVNIYPVETSESNTFVQVRRSKIHRSKALDRGNFNRLSLILD